MRENRPKQDITVAALRNGLRALDEFIGEEQLGVSEVARRLGLAKSTTYRLITTLEAEGFLSRCPRGQIPARPTTSNTVQLSVLEDQMVYASDNGTIYPGDLLGTGTVGTGFSIDLHRWIQPGQTFTLEVQGIGRMQHRVVAGEHVVDHVGAGMDGLLRPVEA